MIEKHNPYSVSGVLSERDSKMLDAFAKLVKQCGGEFVGVQTAFSDRLPSLVFLTPNCKTQQSLQFDPTNPNFSDLQDRIQILVADCERAFESRTLSIKASVLMRWSETISDLQKEIDEALGRTK
jgi:hypothetical protein